MATPDHEDQVCAWHRWITPRENSWGELEKSLRQAARLCVGQRDHLTYWDCMRSLFRHLPNISASKGYRRQNKKSEIHEEDKNITSGKRNKNSNRQNERIGFDVCRLCWRVVQRRKGEAFCYCHITSCEQSDKTTAEHNSRRRKADSKNIRPYSTVIPTDQYSEYWEICCPGLNVYEVQEIENDLGMIEMRRYITTLERVWSQDPTYILKNLPHVYKYLVDRNVRIHSTEHIIEALEHPRPPVGDDEEEIARICFLYDCREFYYMYAPHLIWAEIWLRYEAEQKGRGGARQGAGRPRKLPPESNSAPTKNGGEQGYKS
jgi:hypothetical protein